LILKSQSDVPNFLSDGFNVTATEPWFKVKVEVIQSFLRAFVLNVSSRADEIVFIDLFAGSGLYSIGYQKEIFPGSSFAALSTDLPITQWIFCERDPESIRLLHRRSDRYFKRKNVTILDHELAELPDKFMRIINPLKHNHSVAVFCLVDPFALDIPLTLINSLSSLGFTFLIPFTFPLNERLDYRHYLREHPEKLRKFLGPHNFERMLGVQSNIQFYKRLVRIYQNSMLVMGLNTALSVHRLNSRMMDLPAYHIGLFTRQFSARTILEDVGSVELLEFD
jgi:three-Cys-motif partner protein